MDQVLSIESHQRCVIIDYQPQTLVAADGVVVVISMTNYMVLEGKGEELIAQELDGHHQLSKQKNLTIIIPDSSLVLVFQFDATGKGCF